MSQVQGDVGVVIGLNEAELNRGVARVGQSLNDLATIVEKLGARIDKAMVEAAQGAAQAARATKELTEEEKKAAEAARQAAEEKKRLSEAQKNAARAAREEEKKAKDAAAQAVQVAKQQVAESKRAAQELAQAERARTAEIEKAARAQKQALDNMRQGLQQISTAAAVVAASIAAIAKVSIDAYKAEQSAFLGLESVAQKTIGSVTAAKEASQSLVDDGMMSIVEASKAVQAGLASGFNLQETMDLIEAFKDSAAFNRQAGLEFGESVVRAMEGVRMGNSVLSDSAGITKNLSQILKEAGYAEQDLSRVSSDAAVRRALYNGILKEGALFAGNAAKAADTLAGAEARAGTEAFNTKASIGEALAPAMQVLAVATANVLGKINAFVEANPELARTAFLVVGGLAAMITVVGGLTVAFLSLNASLGLVGWAIVGIGALTGALGGLMLAQKASAAEATKSAMATQDLIRQYEALRRIVDDSTSSTDDKTRAQQRLKDVTEKLFELQPQMRTWFDEEGRILDSMKGKYDDLAAATLKATKAQLALMEVQSIQELESINKRLSEREEEAQGGSGKKSIGKFAKDMFGAIPDAVSWVSGSKSWDEIMQGDADRWELEGLAIDAQKAKIEESLAALRAKVTALELPLDPKEALPPSPGGGAPSPVGDSKMSAALAAAMEDLQDIQALERSPENLERTLARVREILSTHGTELDKLGKSRDLTRMRDIVLPQQILDAADQATSQQFRSALEQLNADTQLKDLSPEAIRERLEAIQSQFADYLQANPDQGLQLDLRLKGATDAELRAPLERWRKLIQENEQLGIYDMAGGQGFKLRALREGQGLALGAGDQSAYIEITGQILELERAINQADFEGKFTRIQEAREKAFTGAADELAKLNKELVTAEAGGDEQQAAAIRQKMLDLVRPALEAQKTALESLLASITGTDEQAAQQRAVIEADLNQVKQDLRDQDLAAHRIATEAKVATERKAEKDRQQAAQDMQTWIQAVAKADLDSIRARQRAEEERAQARIKQMQDELKEMERQWAAEDRRDRIADLRATLAEVEADTRFQKIDPTTGQPVWTYDEDRARELQQQIEDAETEEARAAERERLQNKITAAQDRLNQMRDDHQRELEERQDFWASFERLDAEQLAALASAAEQGLGEWARVLNEQLSAMQKIAEEKAGQIEEALKRIQAAYSNTTEAGSSKIPGTSSSSLPAVPTMPASIGSAVSGATNSTVNLGGVHVTVNGGTDPQATAQAVTTATQQGTDDMIDQLNRVGRAGLRAR